MLKRIILISLAVVVCASCSCGGKKHQKTSPAQVSAEQTADESCNLIGENLQTFLSQNAKPLKQWPFKEWKTKPEGERICGDVLKEFLSLDSVNGYNPNPIIDMSRSEWVERLLNSNEKYEYCGTLNVSDSLDCYIYTVEEETEMEFWDAFALLVKNGKSVNTIQLSCSGYGLFNSIRTNRISRDTFVMETFAIDMIDENGENPGGYYSLRINDDGTVSWSEATESDFNKPTWNK